MKIFEILSSIRPAVMLISFTSIVFFAMKTNLNMFDKIYKEHTDFIE